MNKLLLSFSLLSFFCFSCKENVDTHSSLGELETTYKLLMEEVISGSYESTKGLGMSVYAPDLDIDWEGVTGYTDKSKSDTIHLGQQFRIASITKTFIAAAILKLGEQRKLSLSDPISKFIIQDHIDLLISDRYDPDKIELVHCLNHTSGLFDYAMDEKSYGALILSDPDKVWSRTDQLKFAIEKGEKQSEPGEKYHYSDTGYILLGEVIESLTGLELKDALEILLDINNDTYPNTFLEPIDSTNEFRNGLIHSFFGRTDVSLFNPSMDLYGGGGLISNTKDLSRFYYNIFNNGVFEDNQSLEKMLKKHKTSLAFKSVNRKRNKDYRQGLWEVEIYGEKAYMHSGIWSICCIYIPKYNCSIAVKLTNGSYERLVKKAVLVVKNIAEQN